MSRFIFITLYILQNIFFTDGQNVQPKPTEHACAASTLTLRCPNNYVVVVRDASYGVAQIAGKCTYSTGDCIADAMNIITCTTDSVLCGIYATRKKLPECNDQYSSYIRVEYDCVPMSMDDPAKEYNVCQTNGTEITTDHGLIRSPGYPSQFQTTTAECIRAIHVPSDKTIRLWLSDLYIGSTSTNCANDHVYVVDSVQTHRHCGLKRYAYPYLCSSTILIQYLVKTQSTVLSRYRGMRMFFEIVDRPPNDGCPNSNGTVIPEPPTTTAMTTIDPGIPTTAPIYVILGIASPLRSFQICKGKLFDALYLK
jgi:hypothetical protein